MIKLYYVSYWNIYLSFMRTEYPEEYYKFMFYAMVKMRIVKNFVLKTM